MYKCVQAGTHDTDMHTRKIQTYKIHAAIYNTRYHQHTTLSTVDGMYTQYMHLETSVTDMHNDIEIHDI